MVFRTGWAVAVVLLVSEACSAWAASPGAPAPSGASPAAGAGRPTRSAPPAPAAPTNAGNAQQSTAPPAIPSVSQDAAARSRMHECGHQWSTMKKAGTVGALTWKEFSATCLVVSR